MESWNLWAKAKRNAIEYLAVYISAIGFCMGLLAFSIAILSMWVAYDANENTKVAIMYMNELKAQIEAEK